MVMRLPFAFDVSGVVEWLARVYGCVTFLDVVLALLGLFLFSCAVEKLRSKGRRPMVWPVLGIMPSVPVSQDRIYDWSTQALIGSGGTFPYRGVWFGGAHGIVTCNSANIEYMLKTRFHNFPKGEYYRDRFRDLLGDGIFNVDSDPWKVQRRLATSEMHSARFVDHSYRTVQELVHHKLLKLLEKLSSTGDQIDLQDVLLRFTFDNICTAAFGVDPGCLALELPDVPFATAFELATELTLFRFLMPPYVWKPMRYFQLGYEGRLTKAIRVVHEFADKTVSNRQAKRAKLGNLSDQFDLLSRLMERPNDHDDDGFSNRFLRDFCVSFILAGRDTSSVALAWFFWLVHENPEVECRIVCELHKILSLRQTGIEELNDNVVFTPQELNKMVYLQAALSESLRLYPAVPMEIKEVLDDDVLPDGTALKKGARVLYCIFSMARMESLWGKDCSEFRPERWLRGGEFVSESPFKYAVFNAGPRLCIGKKFAHMQMKMVASSVILRYSIRVAEGCRAIPKLTTTLYMKYGLPVTVQPRSKPGAGAGTDVNLPT